MDNTDRIPGEAFKQGFLFGFYVDPQPTEQELASHNPYPPGTVGHEDWFDGYFENFPSSV